MAVKVEIEVPSSRTWLTGGRGAQTPHHTSRVVSVSAFAFEGDESNNSIVGTSPVYLPRLLRSTAGPESGAACRQLNAAVFFVGFDSAL